MRNKETLYKVLFDIYLVLFVLRTTIFVNNSSYNVIFGGGSIVLILFLISSYEKFRIKNKYALIFFFVSVLVLVHIGMVLIYKHDMLFLLKDVFRYIYLVSIFALGVYYGKISSNNGAIFNTVFLIVLFHAIVGVFNFISGFGVVELHGNQRLYGYFNSAGKFGTLLGFTGILFFIKYHYSGKIFYLILMFVALTLLGLNNSLKSIVVFAGAVGSYFILYKRRFEYIFFIFFIGIVFILINPEVFYRLENIFNASYNPDEIYGTVLENSFQWRLLQWYQLVSDWWHNFTLLGAGIGQETKLQGYQNAAGIPYIAHSDFVKLLIETGLIGFVLISYVVFNFYNKMKIFVVKNDSEIYLLFFYYFLFGGILGSSLITITISLFLLHFGCLVGQKNNIKDYVSN